MLKNDCKKCHHKSLFAYFQFFVFLGKNGGRKTKNRFSSFFAKWLPFLMIFSNKTDWTEQQVWQKYICTTQKVKSYFEKNCKKYLNIVSAVLIFCSIWSSVCTWKHFYQDPPSFVASSSDAFSYNCRATKWFFSYSLLWWGKQGQKTCWSKMRNFV